MYLIEFEIGYDKIKWIFIKIIVQALVFGPYFIKMVTTLFRDTLAIIDINDSLIGVFPLERSIREGFPLDPALFVVIIESIHYLLREKYMGPSVKGLSLPYDLELLHFQFVYDTILFPLLSVDNLNNLINRLDIYCNASYSKIGWKKSTVIGWKDSPPNWFKVFDWKWNYPNKSVQYLGIPFVFNVSLNDMKN